MEPHFLTNNKPKYYVIDFYQGYAKLKLSVHVGTPQPRVFESYGTWHIEGNFLIIFDVNGVRSAHRLPNETKAVTEERLERS